jgi:hypothetical protein
MYPGGHYAAYLIRVWPNLEDFKAGNGLYRATSSVDYDGHSDGKGSLMRGRATRLAQHAVMATPGSNGMFGYDYFERGVDVVCPNGESFRFRVKPRLVHIAAEPYTGEDGEDYVSPECWRVQFVATEVKPDPPQLVPDAGA